MPPPLYYHNIRSCINHIPGHSFSNNRTWLVFNFILEGSKFKYLGIRDFFCRKSQCAVAKIVVYMHLSNIIAVVGGRSGKTKETKKDKNGRRPKCRPSFIIELVSSCILTFQFHIHPSLFRLFRYFFVFINTLKLWCEKLS